MRVNKTDFPRAIMFQGTSSNAGKSLLSAGLCRILRNAGFRVAPFKAQNMSLNSCVTPDGKEIGRAQALQAMACGIEPSALMNPVLVKPMGERVSQIIVLGKPFGTMSYSEYLLAKPEIWQKVKRAYAELSCENDVMVIEGAGSPAEINLRAHDIVNMKMAAYANARVALTADIDRGGAFASLAGTMSLLTRADRQRVCGFVLNKFRGDKKLLADGLSIISRRARKPFIGVMPYLANLRLPDEDSMAFQEAATGLRDSVRNADKLDVALVDLPTMSNITDWDALGAEEGVSRRVARRPEDFGDPDLAILPGARSVLKALDYLSERGFFPVLKKYAENCAKRSRGNLVGICGGLQILGEIVADSSGQETGEMRCGLGLLPVRTEFLEQKILRRSECLAERCLCGDNVCVRGYEIHHGQTGGEKARTVMRDAAGAPIGWGAFFDDNSVPRVWGTYLHGIFDADGFRHAFLNRLFAEAGIERKATGVCDADGELDRLEEAMTEHLDIDLLLGEAGKSRALPCE